MVVGIFSLQNSTRITGASHDSLGTSIAIVFGWIILRMRNITYKGAEKIKTHTVCSKKAFPKVLPFFRLSVKISYNRTGHRWHLIWYMRFACWMSSYALTFRLCNTYCLPTAKIFNAKGLSITFWRTLTVIFSLYVFLLPFTGGRFATKTSLVQAILPNV